MKAALYSLINFIVYSNLFVSLCALALTHLTYILLKLPTNNYLLVLIFCSTYFTYNFQRLIKLTFHSPVKDKNVRLAWVIKHKFFLLTSGIITVIISIITCFNIKLFTIISLFPFALMSAFYVIPIIPFQKRMVELRKIPFIKIVIITIVWSYTTVVLPYINNDNYIYNNNLSVLSITLIKQAIFIFAITLPFDIGDIEFDVKSNLKTIPNSIGIKKTIFLSETLLAIYISLTYFQYYKHQITLDQFLSFLGCTIVTGVIIFFSSKKRPELFYSGLLEGTMILLYLGIIILKYN